MTQQQPDGLDLVLSAAPRRRVLRSLAGAALGMAALVGLAGGGGGDEEEDEEEGEEDD